MSTTATPGSPNKPTLAPIRIEVGGLGSDAFKSIDHLVWDDIPSFAVLTGLNGSGKTQLLELLAYKLTGTSYRQRGDLDKVRVTVTGDTLGPDSVAYIPSRWDFGGAPALAIGQMESAKQQLFNELNQDSHNDMRHIVKRARILRLLGISAPKQLAQEAFVERLPDDFGFMLDQADITAGLGHVFLAHRLRVAEELERGTSLPDATAKLGPAPWDIVNEIFQVAEFPYRVVSPMRSRMLDTYQLRFEDPSSGLLLRPMDLSSGEKTLLGLVIWLYNSQHHRQFPRLFLLDEPDAHLHPSMTRHFINVIKDVLVDRHGVRTILTTHSPSTVALAPEGALFEMSRTQPRITPSKSKGDTIGLLTAGMVIVSPGTRYVLVEDEADVDFYGMVRDILTDYGPSRDPRAIRPSPTVVFLPASRRTGEQSPTSQHDTPRAPEAVASKGTRIGGGNTVVSQWVGKLNEPPLDEMFRGIIDRDSGNNETPRVHVIGRHSIENYLLDAFVVYGLLLDNGTAPPAPEVVISQGDEHQIRDLSVEHLKAILSAIQKRIEPVLPAFVAPDTLPRRVAFTNGKALDYPAWMLDRRGHDLLPLYQSLFGGAKVISPPRLQKSFRRVRLVPVELADILDKLQSRT